MALIEKSRRPRSSARGAGSTAGRAPGRSYVSLRVWARSKESPSALTVAVPKRSCSRALPPRRSARVRAVERTLPSTARSRSTASAPRRRSRTAPPTRKVGARPSRPGRTRAMPGSRRTRSRRSPWATVTSPSFAEAVLEAREALEAAEAALGDDLVVLVDQLGHVSAVVPDRALAAGVGARPAPESPPVALRAAAHHAQSPVRLQPEALAEADPMAGAVAQRPAPEIAGLAAAVADRHVFLALVATPDLALQGDDAELGLAGRAGAAPSPSAAGPLAASGIPALDLRVHLVAEARVVRVHVGRDLAAGVQELRPRELAGGDVAPVGHVVVANGGVVGGRMGTR